MIEENGINKEYNIFSNIRKVTRQIVDYLVDNNCQDLLKLLYYGNTEPLMQPDLTITDIQNMICKDPLLEDTSKKNILFQTEIDDGFSASVSQLRIEIGDIYPINAHQGAIQINFQIVVPHKQKLIVTDVSDVDDRSVAIFQELAKIFNGTVIGNLCSPMYLDRRGMQGGTTGAFREKQNKNYSGYWATFVALC